MLVLLLVCLLLPGSPAGAGGEGIERASIFGSVEVRSSDLSAFHKWRAALDRAAAEEREFAAQDASLGRCAPESSPACLYRAWLRFLDGLRASDPRSQLEAVNRELNRHRYVSDPVNWGVEDYWESPGEFLARDGDCEDFAIAKYFSLRRLGWPAGSLRLVAVRDLHLNVGHAVLVAFLEGRAWMLDNQIQEVTDTDEVRGYDPVFSIDETAWWRHLPRGGSRDGERMASLPTTPTRAR